MSFNVAIFLNYVLLSTPTFSFNLNQKSPFLSYSYLMISCTFYFFFFFLYPLLPTGVSVAPPLSPPNPIRATCCVTRDRLLHRTLWVNARLPGIMVEYSTRDSSVCTQHATKHSRISRSRGLVEVHPGPRG